ncbi:MAG: dTDP-4-dehydrorhamnose 3,5-epimerase family protein [bacterium]|nr:dTDP-4-dehydrorhamnose 3,5-epimerase family protein [bacterium]
MAIEGVKIKKLIVHEDVPDVPESVIKRGTLAEILRDDEGLLKKFGQATVTITYSGTIKGFHWHERQDDLWFVAAGKVMVVLHDLRADSTTSGLTQTIEAGEDDLKVILIPTGVAHGYKVISEKPAMLIYHTTEHYDPKNLDEKRIPYDDPKIGFDWNKI